MDRDLSVNELIFLKREYLASKTSAHLIASGPWGMIHFWNVFANELYARFKIVSIFNNLNYYKHIRKHLLQMIT